MTDHEFVNIENELESIINDSKIFRFQLELTQVNDDNKKILLEKIIKKINTSTLEVNNDSSKFKNLITEFANKVYLQPWLKLKSMHHEDRLKKFVEEKFKDEQKKSDLINLLLENNKSGYFKKKDSVVYNSVNGTIIEIPNLKKDDNGTYLLEVPKTKKTIKKKAK